MTMTETFDASTLHRTAKLFMDDGSAASAEDALDRLRGFGLTIVVGPAVARSGGAQIALLTLVNVARRTFLGGVEVMGLGEARSEVLYPGRTLRAAVAELGGHPVDAVTPGRPIAAIGVDPPHVDGSPSWRLTWEGWRGGVVPGSDARRLVDDDDVALAPAIAAAVCAAEVFAWHAGERGTAGRRAAGLSLWRPGADWLARDETAPALCYLPSRLWVIGLGNLGQAFAWALACLPYARGDDVRLVLQDDDRVGVSNDSTSVLSSLDAVGERKARVVARWLEERGFEVAIEERRFGPWMTRAADEPALAFCGVDNALARSSLEDAGFGLVVEAGLGAGPQAFRSIGLHAFPGSRTAREVWSAVGSGEGGTDVVSKAAYAKLAERGMDDCGLAQVASRTVGVPFVGMTASCLALGEILRRMHGATAREVVVLSMTALADAEVVEGRAEPFVFGHVPRRP